MKLTSRLLRFYPGMVEIHFTPEQEAQLSVIAGRTGRDPEQVVRAIVTSLLENEAAFIEAIRKGFASLDRGDYIAHEEMGQRIERLFPA